MGWEGEQSYYISATAEQAVALTLIAEAFFKNEVGENTKDVERRIYCGTYRVIDESRAAEITHGQSLYEAGHVNRIVMTPHGPRVKHKALATNPQALPKQELVGIVFPFAYQTAGDWYQPISFVFARELTPRLADRPWRLVTAVPFVADGGGDDWLPYKQEQTTYNLWNMGLLGDFGNSFWPEGLIIQPTVVVGTRDGCRISLRRRSPYMVTEFLYFVQHHLGIVFDTEPDVTTTVENDFRSNWEADFKAGNCFNDNPERVEFWRRAFGVGEPHGKI